MKIYKLTIGSFFLTLIFSLFPTPSYAHSELINTSFSKDRVILTSDKSIDLEFNEPVTISKGGLLLQNLTGGLLFINDRVLKSDTFSIKINNLKKGYYILRYNVKSEDGHFISNSIVLNYKMGNSTNNLKPLVINNSNSSELKLERSSLKLGEVSFRFFHKGTLSVYSVEKNINFDYKIESEKILVSFPFKGKYILSYKIEKDEFTQLSFIEKVVIK